VGKHEYEAGKARRPQADVRQPLTKFDTVLREMEAEHGPFASWSAITHAEMTRRLAVDVPEVLEKLPPLQFRAPVDLDYSDPRRRAA
jgi:hypothetical protein